MFWNLIPRYFIFKSQYNQFYNVIDKKKFRANWFYRKYTLFPIKYISFHNSPSFQAKVYTCNGTEF